jgi:predicted RNA-binding Zn ribbon-like protein
MGQDGLVSFDRAPVSAFAEIVDGVLLPRPLSGSPVLDFCNTCAGWNDADRHDYLRTYDDLVVWAAANGLVEPDLARRLRGGRRRRGRTADVLEEARTLRADLYAVLVRPTPGRSWRRIAASVGEANGATVLELGPSGPRWRLAAPDGVRLPILAVARAAGEFLTSGDARFVHACPGTGCGWLFLDRGGRRRWCTMSICGNRAKARRFAERRRRSSRSDSMLASGS